MKLGEEAALILQTCDPLRPGEDWEAGVTYLTEDPRLSRAMAIPATECSRNSAPNFPEKHMRSKKDVKSWGTNIISPLESTKVSKNKLKMGPKQSGKTCSKQAKESKQSKGSTSKGQVGEDRNNLPRGDGAFRAVSWAFLGCSGCASARVCPRAEEMEIRVIVG